MSSFELILISVSQVRVTSQHFSELDIGAHETCTEIFFCVSLLHPEFVSIHLWKGPDQEGT